MAGFYHEGYEQPLLMLMKRRGVHSGLVVKVVLSSSNRISLQDFSDNNIYPGLGIL